VPFETTGVESRAWSSATFVGDRVTLRLACGAHPRLPAWLESLPEAELAMDRCYVADLCVRSVECGAQDVTIVLDALVLADG
jgi:hypothetical protein